jgi:hypothetical protein
MAVPSPSVASRFEYRTYAANSSIAPHLHDAPSLTLVLGGAYEERIAGRTALQREGCALICPQGLPHAQRFGARGARKIIVTPGATLLDYLRTTTMFSSAPSVRAAPIGKLARQILAERSPRWKARRGRSPRCSGAGPPGRRFPHPRSCGAHAGRSR